MEDPVHLSLFPQAFHCAEPASRQVACAPLFATLLAYEVYYGLTEDEGAEPSEHQVRSGIGQVDGSRPPWVEFLHGGVKFSFSWPRGQFGGCFQKCCLCPSQLKMATDQALGDVTVLGSLLLQHLLHFSTPGLVLRSLGTLTGPQLLALAQSPAGSHVLDAVLTSPSVTRKQRRRVLKILKVSLVPAVLTPSSPYPPPVGRVYPWNWPLERGWTA